MHARHSHPFRAFSSRAYSNLAMTRRAGFIGLGGIARGTRLCGLSRTVEYKCKIGSSSRRTQCGDREKAESIKRRYMTSRTRTQTGTNDGDGIMGLRGRNGGKKNAVG